MSIDQLVGKTIIKITGLEAGGDRVQFTTSDDEDYIMHHVQDCCESVSIDNVSGDVEDLLDTPILLAEEVSNNDFENQFEEDCRKEGGYIPESYTWTFYKLATIKGYVDIRWYGESNGYYSERVEFEKMN